MCTLTRSFGEKSSYETQSTPKEFIKTRRRTIHDEKLLKVFLSQPDQPLGAEPTNCNKNEDITIFSDENTPPTNGYNHIQESNCQRSKAENLRKGSHGCNEMSSPKILSQEDLNRRENPFFARIQRDLNSPSAAARIRALKALKNPVQNSYSNFDVPHEEQDIITEEERTLPMRSKSIQEVMKDVVVYVEVRTGEDNRSAGVKKVISLLGAKVNDKFLRDTTHVVFKDGLQSTYNKAKKWNIPIVSILWIEACKKQMKLINPILYPISNVERYENPDLFTKSRRLKSMQPNAEEYSRRKKTKNNKETETGKTARINSALRIPRKPKDKLDEIFSEFQEKLMNTPDNNDDDVPFESKLLQRLRNSPFTPKSLIRNADNSNKNSFQRSTLLESTFAPSDNDDDFDISINNKSLNANAKKTLNFSDFKNKTASFHDNNTQKTPRRRNLEKDVQKLQTEKNFLDNISRTRSSCSTQSLFNAGSLSKTMISENIISKNSKTTPMEKKSTVETLEPNNEKKGDRRTTFTTRSMDISIEANVSFGLSSAPSTEKNKSRRRTLYTPHLMEQCNTDKVGGGTRKISINKSRTLGLAKPIGRRKTIFNPSCPQEEIMGSSQSNNNELGMEQDILKEGVSKGESFLKTPRTLLEDHAATLIFSSTKTPQNLGQKTLFDISMDIISQRMQAINKSAKLNEIDCANVLQEYSATPNCRKPESRSNRNINIDCPTKDANKTNSSSDLEADKSKISCKMTDIEQVPKKRKLFAPVDMSLTPTQLLTHKALNSTHSSSKKKMRENGGLKNKKKTRQTLFDHFKLTDPSTKEKLFRRSTMDFEATKTKTSNTINNVESKLPFLVYTNMHTEQVSFINKTSPPQSVVEMSAIAGKIN